MSHDNFSTPSEDTAPSLSWQYTETAPELAVGEIHVWRIGLDGVEGVTADTAECCLSQDERTRAQRFLADKHRRRFCNGRRALRQVLARYLRISAAELVFGYTGLGKPFLKNENANAMELQFNFSNSEELGLLAVTRRGEVGVDLECLRDLSDMEGLAKRFFAADEYESIMACDDRIERQRRFFRCWTRKEAFLKAVGTGLTFPLCKVCVTSRAEEEARILWIDDDTDHASRWSLYHLDPHDRYLGALAIPDHGRSVLKFDYDSPTRFS
jgi:4'-phosphopantetheinyl transferase